MEQTWNQTYGRYYSNQIDFLSWIQKGRMLNERNINQNQDISQLWKVKVVLLMDVNTA
jgi:hypothetical protein